MSREKGKHAESLACSFLEENGYTLVDSNVYSRFGEIDIIVRKSGILHFIEVKSADDYEAAIQNITPAKLSKIIKTAQIYMKKVLYEGDFEFDAVIVTPQGVQMVENITL